eukprot:31534-Pelagococcus_subviridis.AAC.2
MRARPRATSPSTALERAGVRPFARLAAIDALAVSPRVRASRCDPRGIAAFRRKDSFVLRDASDKRLTSASRSARTVSPKTSGRGRHLNGVVG